MDNRHRHICHFHSKSICLIPTHFRFLHFLHSINLSGNVVGSSPYAVGSPSCSNYGMYPSSRYSGLCQNNGRTPAHTSNVITNTNTFTFKSERINPVVYQTYRKPAPTAAAVTYKSNYSNAVSAYQQALQAYNSHQTQASYQRALQAYAVAYPSALPTYYKPVQVKTVQPGYSTYNWSNYIQNGFRYKK